MNWRKWSRWLVLYPVLILGGGYQQLAFEDARHSAVRNGILAAFLWT